MGYTKHNFIKNQILTADHLNQMENEIAKLSNVFNWGGSQTIPASTNLLNPAEIEYGKYLTAAGVMGSNSNYMVTGFIPVKQGDKITLQYDYATGTPLRQVRWIHRVTAYDIDKNVIASAGTDETIQNAPYIVPNNIAYVRITIFVNSEYYNYAICNSEDVLPYEEHYSESIVTTETTLKPMVYTKINNGYTVNIDQSWQANTENHDLCGYTMVYRANILDGFTSLEMGKGKFEYQGVCIKIDLTNISIYFGESQETIYIYPHNLTFADYINVIIAVGYDAKAKITILTNGGKYVNNELSWNGVRRGAFFVNSPNTTKAKFSYYSKGWGTDTHIYGDSYIAAIAYDRWTHYLLNDTHNVLLNGYSGRNSAKALLILKDTLKYCKRPQRIIWCLGMNDGDSQTINTNWQAAVEELKAICEQEAIELILTTIPNTPSVNNMLKNEYVRNSGYRYIDFASSVGALEDSTWYTNMLSSDNVHPSPEGAIALYSQAIIDVPELLI